MGIDNKHKTVLDAFAESAGRFANNPAVFDEESVFTYGELDVASDCIAQALLDAGLKRGSMVLVCLPRCKEVLAAALGVGKAGCVFVLSDTSYPAERLEYMAADCGAAVVLTTRAVWEEKPLSAGKVKPLFIDEMALDAVPVPAGSFPRVDADDAAFVVYTSGSTGHPKGVLHSHRSLFHDANFYPSYEPPASESLRYCHIAGFSFIAGYTDLFTPLLCGGATTIYSDKTRLDPSLLYKRMVADGVTCLNTSIRYAIHFLENYDMRTIAVRMGGEKLPAFRPLYPSIVTEIYGSSEGNVVGYLQVREVAAQMPFAHPSEGVEWSVIGDDGLPVGQGEVGELAFSGQNTPVCYLNRPELNAEKFFEADGKRWFKTGDLVRQDEQGTYYFVERKDFMIKLRGFRIEPGEIERQVKAFDGNVVADCVCVAKKVGGEDRLCCYYEAREPVDEGRLREHLGKTLAAYLIPEYFVALDALPKNANGKVDRGQLPDITFNMDDETMSSLGIMKLSAEVYQRYGLNLEFEKLASLVTKKKILDYIDQRRASFVPRPGLPQQVEHATRARLNFAQRGVYVDCIAEPNSLRYNLPTLIKLPPDVTLAELRRVVVAVLDRHPDIDVVFGVEPDGHVYQTLPERIPTRDIPHKTMSEEALSSYKRNSVKPFDVQGGTPLYRIETIRTESGLYLFVDFHHLIFDGLSFYTFIFDMNRALLGQEIYPETFTSLDFAAEQERLEQSPEFEAIHDFWQSRLSLLDGSSEIYPDLPAGGRARGEAKMVARKVDPLVVRDFARVREVRPSSVYLAALLYLVGAYTNEENVGIVTISSGRRDTRIASDIGMFVNTLPVVCQIPQGAICDFIRAVERDFLEAISHENYPFPKLVQEFGYKPNIMFAYQESVFRVRQIKEGFTFQNFDYGDAKFPLYFAITGYGDDVSMTLQYDTAKFSATFAEDLLETYDHLIGQFCTLERLDQVEFCTESQVRALDGFNAPLPALPKDETIVSLFAKSVRAYPDRPAIVFRDSTLTYGELDAKSDALARRIMALAADALHDGREPVVSITVGRNENMIVCSLAALKAGCAYQPIDPTYPDERVELMITDAAPVMVVAQREFADRFAGFDVPVLVVEEAGSLPAEREGLAEAARSIDAHSLFTLLYTSGSTGRPKGVMLEHGNLVAFCRWYRRYYNLDERCCVGAYASYGFDANMMDVYPALTCGACVCIVPEDIRLDMDRLGAYLAEKGVTHCFMTTQVGVQFHLSQNVGTLRYLSVGGEKLAAIKPRGSHVLVNAYGPTECTIFSTTKKVLESEPDIPIGTPVDSLACRIVSKDGRRVPIGAVGELILVGDQVGRGYLGDEEKTRRSFFEIDGRRAYRTGDVVRYRRCGDIEFVGRNDQQVKIRGFRIEPKEVELAVRDCPGVTDATVQCFGSAETGHYLVAYVVGEGTLDPEGIKAALSATKPSYMVPSYVLQIDAIPLNANFKVDRRALPKPESVNADSYSAPTTEKERIVATCVADTIGITSQVGAGDSFTMLGGDSIVAIRLSSKLREAGLDISANSILRLDTVAPIARACSKVFNLVPAEQGEVVGVVPETPMTSYFKRLKLKYPSQFNQCIFYRASKRIDADLLKEAFTALVRHHDILRSRFINGQLEIMSIESAPPFRLRESACEDVEGVANEMHASMDLEAGPLVQACIFRLERSDYLLVSIHHLLVDGVSWRIIGDDLNAIYGALIAGEQVALPPKSNSVIDYARSIERYRTSPSLLAQRPYWEGVRAALADTMLTDARNRVAGQTPMRHRLMTLDEKTCERLSAYASLAGNTLDYVLIAALGKSLGNNIGIAKMSLICESHGRNDYDGELCIDRSVGWFTALYPVCIEGLQSGIDELVAQVGQTMNRVPKCGLGYEVLYREDRSYLPLVTFNNLGKMDSVRRNAMFSESSEYSLGNFIHPQNLFGTDLNFNGFFHKGVYTIDFEYNNEVFDSALIERICEDFHACLIDVGERACAGEVSKFGAEGETESSSDERGIAIDLVADAFAASIPEVSRDEVFPESDFFSLGGDRFSVVDVAERLCEVFGISVKPATIYEHPTVLELARFCCIGADTPESQLVHVYSEGARKPSLFFVHTANSGSEAYYRLAKRIESVIAFTAANQYNLLHEDDKVWDIVGLAKRYLSALKACQPNGPYNLGGWCLGGTIAWEMARQLLEAGEDVERLVLIDAQIVENPRDRQLMNEHAALNCEDYILSSPLLAENRKKYPLDALVENYRNITRAWLDYDPPALEGIDVLFIKATVNPGSNSKEVDRIVDAIITCDAAGYEKKLPRENLTIVPVDQDHDSLMSDHSLDIIVPKLKKFLLD